MFSREIFNQGAYARILPRSIFSWLGLGCVVCSLIALTSCHPLPQKTESSKAAKRSNPTPSQLRLPEDRLSAVGLETVWERQVLDGPYRNVYVLEDYVFAVSPRGGRYRLVAYDRASGNNVWTQLLDKTLAHPPAIFHYPDGAKQPSELFGVLGDTVVCMDLKQGGVPLWSRDLDFPVSSGVCASETHYFVGSFDRRIYGIRKKEAIADWSYITDGDVRSAGIVEGVNVYFTATDGRVYHFHEKQGPKSRDFWRYRTDDRILGSPVPHSRWIYAASTDYKLYALLELDGSKDWEFQAQAPIRTTPLVASFRTRPRQDVVFCISEDDRPRHNRRTLWALNVAGERLWRVHHVAKIVATGRKSVYVLADRRMNRGKILLSIDVKTGKENFALPVDGFDIFPVSAGTTTSDKLHAATIVLAHRTGYMQALGETY